jgi:hypothetical protein
MADGAFRRKSASLPDVQFMERPSPQHPGGGEGRPNKRRRNAVVTTRQIGLVFAQRFLHFCREREDKGEVGEKPEEDSIDCELPHLIQCSHVPNCLNAIADGYWHLDELGEDLLSCSYGQQ